METILSKRRSSLIRTLPALALLALSVLWALWSGSGVSTERINARIRAQVDKADSLLQQRMDAIRERARELADRYRAGDALPDPLPGEALVKVVDGRIHWHHGSVMVPPVAMDQGGTDWGLARLGDRIFMLVDSGSGLRYMAPLLQVKRNFILERFEFPLAQYELSVLRNPSPGATNQYTYDDLSAVFIVTAPLRASGGRLVLSLKILRNQVIRHLRHRRRIQAFVPACLALLVIFLGLARLRHPLVSLAKGLILLALVLALAFLVASWARGSILIQAGDISLVSVFQVLALSLWLLFPTFAGVRRKISSKCAVVMADLLLIAGIWASYALLQRVLFYFGTFSLRPEFVALMLVLFLFHIPALPRLHRVRFPRRLAAVTGLVVSQVIAVTMVAWLLPQLLVPFAIVAAAVPAMLLLRPGIFRRVLVMGLVALSIFSLTTTRDEANKREFITENLRHIFLNQGNYAKLIAREIVHEMNMVGQDLSLFFRLNNDSTLRDLWRSTLAARESIPSGITILSPEMRVLNQFSHQIPYVPEKEPRFFPVWAVADVRVRLYGREIAQARASIAVYEGGRHLGFIVIQVLNSPELILRQKDESNLFALDPRLGRTPMNYIKLNRDREILENPGQVNLSDVSGLFRHDGRWVRFSHENALFAGYVFTGGADPIMIYYQLPSLLRRLASWIRLLLLCLILSIVPVLKSVPIIPWRRLTHSFSVRVFAILVLIALFTGVVFSVFSLNFHRNSLERERMRHTFNQGRTAQNIVNGMIGGKQGLTRNQVFFLASMMNADVTVFRRGEREFTSDIRQILRGRIPEYMDSRVMDLLSRRKQKFVLRRIGEGQTVYFPNGEFVFRLDFDEPWRGLGGGGDSYTDFVTVMIFFLGLIGLSVAVFFRDRILEPIRTLNQGMAEVETGGLPRLEPQPREHELQALYKGFNNMIRGIAAQRRNISEISRMRTLVDLGRRVAHEVKNPLTPIKLSAEQIRRSLEDKRHNYEQTILKSVDFIIDETEHLKKVSYGFLDLSRLDAIDAGNFNLDELLQEEVLHFRQVYPKIDFDLKLPQGNLRVRLDAVKIRQMVKNILSNSIEAIGEGPGEIRVALDTVESDVELTFEDNGTGMDQAEVARIFDMDYSTKDSGTGLGMFIINRIVDLHGGHLNVESRHGEGTRIRVTLPSRAQSRE